MQPLDDGGLLTSEMPVPEHRAAVDRHVLRDSAYDKLCEAIVDGTLAPGEPLHDGELCGWLGLSRTPVRDALNRLRDDGLVEMAPQRFTRVATMSVNDVHEVGSVLERAFTPARSGRRRDRRASGCIARRRSERVAAQVRASEKERRMADSVYRVTEVIGVSSESWEAAARAAVETAAKTVRDLRIAEVVRQDLTIEEGGVTSYRVRLAISFKYDSGD